MARQRLNQSGSLRCANFTVSKRLTRMKAALGTATAAVHLWVLAISVRFFRTTLILQYTHQLAITGPCKSHFRLPYTSHLVMVLGTVVIMANWISSLIILVMLLIGYGSAIWCYSS